MMQPTTEFRQLLEKLDSARESATQMKAKLLLQEVDALEERIKNVGSIGMRLKTVQKDYSKEVERLQEKLYAYATEGIEGVQRMIRRIMLGVALGIAILFFISYISRSLAPQQPVQIVTWLVVGILGSSFVGLNFYLLYLALLRRDQRVREKRGLEPSVISYHSVSFLIFSTPNTMSFTLQLLLTWVYPFSSSFLEGLVNRIMQGDLLATLYAFITALTTIIGLVQGIYSLLSFLKKVFRRK